MELRRLPAIKLTGSLLCCQDRSDALRVGICYIKYKNEENYAIRGQGSAVFWWGANLKEVRRETSNGNVFNS